MSGDALDPLDPVAIASLFRRNPEAVTAIREYAADLIAQTQAEAVQWFKDRLAGRIGPTAHCEQCNRSVAADSIREIAVTRRMKICPRCAEIAAAPPPPAAPA